MDCTIRVGKTKALVSFAVTAKLICACVYAYANCWFSHAKAQFYAGTIVHHCGRASDSDLRGPGFDPHWRHHVVSLKQGTLTLKSTT